MTSHTTGWPQFSKADDPNVRFTMILDDDDELCSADEALCELLGISSLNVTALAIEDDDSINNNSDEMPKQSLDELIRIDDATLRNIARKHRLQELYTSSSFCILPDCLSVPANLMRRLTDSLVWGKAQSDKSYETVQVFKNGETINKRVLTRLENFVNYHEEWRMLCYNYLLRCVSEILGEPYLLYKEKLNLKPPGGTGFAPHLDTPSLRIALGEDGPQNFITVMVAIDNMTVQNGCLKIVPGTWSEDTACPVERPDPGGNPDGDGRAGAIPADVAEQLGFQSICCKAGSIVIFNGWAPHRSAANVSPFSRRAVYLTYNPASEGMHHERYYERMAQLRNEWKIKSGWMVTTEDAKCEFEALSTIPRI